jgi:hypothetical protein
MDLTLRQEILKLSGPLLSRHDWASLEALWRPYVDEGDLDAQAYLAYMCLWCFDETEEKIGRCVAYSAPRRTRDMRTRCIG